MEWLEQPRQTKNLSPNELTYLIRTPYIYTLWVHVHLGTRDFCSALALDGPVQNIFFLTVHYFSSYVPTAQQTGWQLSWVACLLLCVSGFYSQQGHPSLESLWPIFWVIAQLIKVRPLKLSYDQRDLFCENRWKKLNYINFLENICFHENMFKTGGDAHRRHYLELRGTLLSKAAPFWNTLYPTELQHTVSS